LQWFVLVDAAGNTQVLSTGGSGSEGASHTVWLVVVEPASAAKDR